ncbi:MAG TPA: hypothetical protein VGM06_02315 [Polyangiaceae bacterium]|jgi:serine/threonine-protein kinase
MGSTKSARLFVLLASLVAVTASAGSRADTPGSEADKIAAQALFEDARRLATAGNYTDACPKFAESQRIDPSPSTLLNLANCWEKVGRTATAWVTYREAQSAASAIGRKDYVDTAERHARALASTLAHLTVSVVQPVDGMQVRRDGVAMGAPEWGLGIPVDAGAHVVEAVAAGYKAWSQTVDVPNDGAQVTVSVPPLEALPPDATAQTPAGAAIAPVPSAPPTETGITAPPPEGSQRMIGLVVGAAGVVGLGVSGVFALLANSDHQAALKNCVGTLCTASGFAKENDARSNGDASTVAFLVGAAALVTGGVLWLAAPRRPAGVAASISVSPTLGGAVVEAAW